MAAVVASEATVTSVTTVININTIHRVPSKASKPIRAVNVGYGIGDADEVLLGGLFDLILYCNFYNKAVVGRPLQLLVFRSCCSLVAAQCSNVIGISHKKPNFNKICTLELMWAKHYIYKK